jgi:hypothetical protein
MSGQPSHRSHRASLSAARRTASAKRPGREGQGNGGRKTSLPGWAALRWCWCWCCTGLGWAGLRCLLPAVLVLCGVLCWGEFSRDALPCNRLRFACAELLRKGLCHGRGGDVPCCQYRWCRQLPLSGLGMTRIRPGGNYPSPEFRVSGLGITYAGADSCHCRYGRAAVRCAVTTVPCSSDCIATTGPCCSCDSSDRAVL